MAYNVVIHEFAHKLDMLDGEADGVPALHSGLTREGWDAVFLPAWDDGLLAGVSEHFFETPAVVAGEYPALYALFKAYYRQDPLARLQMLQG